MSRPTTRAGRRVHYRPTTDAWERKATGAKRGRHAPLQAPTACQRCHYPGTDGAALCAACARVVASQRRETHVHQGTHGADWVGMQGTDGLAHMRRDMTQGENG